MHNLARVSLVVGGLITAIGLITFVFGVGAAAGFDLEDDAKLIGSDGTFTVTDSHFGLEIYAKGSVDCESFTVEIIDSDGNNDYFNRNCGGGISYEGYTYLGYFAWLEPSGTYTVNAQQTVVVTDNAGGEAGGGFLSICCGLPALICGILWLVLGGLLGLALKDKQNVVMSTVNIPSTPPQS